MLTFHRVDSSTVTNEPSGACHTLTAREAAWQLRGRQAWGKNLLFHFSVVQKLPLKTLKIIYNQGQQEAQRH